MAKRQYLVFQDGFWSSPRANKKRQGDPSVDPIYHAVGAALSAWEGVEEALATLYVVLTDAKEANAANTAARCFGAIENSSARRVVMLTAAEMYFQHYWARDAVRRPVEALMETAKLAGFIRNEIAHGKALRITSHGQTSDGIPETKEVGAFLLAPEYMTGRRVPWISPNDPEDPLSFVRSSYRYTASDIHLFADKFGLLLSKVWDYASSIQRNEHGVPKNVMDYMVKEAEDREKKQTLKHPL